MIAAQRYSVALDLRCDGKDCAERITVHGDGIPAAYDAAEGAGWRVRARIGRHYCPACTVPADSGRGTTITQDASGKVVVRS